jgi:hypothetical protein
VVVAPSGPGAIENAAARVHEIAAGYHPPQFAYVPGPDAALFLCAIDHRTGYGRAFLVGGRGPYDGSALLWALGCAAEDRRPGTLSAGGLREVTAERVEELFQIGGETVAGAEERARLWRNLAEGMLARYGGSTAALLGSCEGRLGGAGGLIARLAEFEAYGDPLQKKSFLFAKIAARRGWLAVSDPETWEVCADNVLMRLGLRSGLVDPDPDPERLRAATREAFHRVATEAGIEPPLLDDLLWELGRRDGDLLGTAGGSDLREPARPAGMHWY